MHEHSTAESVVRDCIERYIRCAQSSLLIEDQLVMQAVTLECMRGAFRQKRQCFLYAFGGPGQVEGFELSLKKPGVMEGLLKFLRFSFGGGTDVDRPLELALARLEQAEWKQVMNSVHFRLMIWGFLYTSSSNSWVLSLIYTDTLAKKACLRHALGLQAQWLCNHVLRADSI